MEKCRHTCCVFVITDLCKELNQFVTRELSKYEDELAEQRIKAVKNDDVSADQLMTNWTNAFTEVNLLSICNCTLQSINS